MLNEVLIILALSVAGIAVFRRLDIPAVLGYLVVGLLAGEHAFGWIHVTHAIEQIAEIGVVFLLFTIGLEVSVARLVAMRNIVFRIGVVQVIISTLSTIAIGVWLVGLSVDWFVGWLLACCWLGGWVVGWSVGWLVVGRLIVWLVVHYIASNHINL